MTTPTGMRDGGGHTGRARLVAVTLVGIAAGIAAGWLAITLTRPSTDELQRAALDEIGLPTELESAPMIGPALDAYTDRVEARVVEESRPSAMVALAIGVTVAVVATVAVTATADSVRARSRRRSR